jgi:hypothetical protein
MKENRERLFRGSKPVLRPATPDDMGWLWAAYKFGAFREIGDVSQDEFTARMTHALQQFPFHTVIEDRNAKFSKGQGPIGIVGALFNGWRLEPHVEWYPWATKRNQLRGTVAYLMRMRYDRNIGNIQVRARKDDETFFNRMGKYLPLKLVGTVVAGRPDGDEVLYSIRGKKRWGGVVKSIFGGGSQKTTTRIKNDPPIITPSRDFGFPRRLETLSHGRR